MVWFWLYFEESQQNYLMDWTWDLRKTDKSDDSKDFDPSNWKLELPSPHQGRLWMLKVWERRAVLC